MKITFSFQNGASTITLEPTTAREKTLIQLFRENAEGARLMNGPSPEALAFEAVVMTAIKPKDVDLSRMVQG